MQVTVYHILFWNLIKPTGEGECHIAGTDKSLYLLKSKASNFVFLYDFLSSSDFLKILLKLFYVFIVNISCAFAVANIYKLKYLIKFYQIPQNDKNKKKPGIYLMW